MVDLLENAPEWMRDQLFERQVGLNAVHNDLKEFLAAEQVDVSQATDFNEKPGEGIENA